MAHKGVGGSLEQGLGAAHLHRTATGHDHHLLGKRQRFDLVVGNVNQGVFELLMHLFELATQLPLQVRVDDGERLIKQNRRHIGPDQAPPKRNFLFSVG